MNCLWIVCVLAVVRGASVQSGNVQWFDLETAQKHPEQLHILRTKAGINFQPYEQAWKEFKILHGKSYRADEESHRFEIFRKNVQIIEEHNKLYHSGEKSYCMGVNQFADLTHAEFLEFNGLYKTTLKKGKCSTSHSTSSFVTPVSIDWRAKGYVTDVKNQGRCGACWAFSTTGSLEGQHFRKTRKLVSLSEQQLVDCSGSFGNIGCVGGNVDKAFQYITSVGGIETEADYPYKEKEQNCTFDESKIAAKVSGCVDVDSGNETALQKCVAEIGPVSVSIDASHQSFKLYECGVYNETACSTKNLKHSVLVVGYGTDNKGREYWIVKNSWGQGWGDWGYIKMIRNQKNQCGIATRASYPLV